MTYYAEMNNSKVKKFSAKTLETAYKQYNNYCKDKLIDPELKPDKESLGLMSWQTNVYTIRLKSE